MRGLTSGERRATAKRLDERYVRVAAIRARRRSGHARCGISLGTSSRRGPWTSSREGEQRVAAPMAIRRGGRGAGKCSASGASMLLDRGTSAARKSREQIADACTFGCSSFLCSPRRFRRPWLIARDIAPRCAPGSRGGDDMDQVQLRGTGQRRDRHDRRPEVRNTVDGRRRRRSAAAFRRFAGDDALAVRSSRATGRSAPAPT